MVAAAHGVSGSRSCRRSVPTHAWRSPSSSPAAECEFAQRLGLLIWPPKTAALRSHVAAIISALIASPAIACSGAAPPRASRAWRSERGRRLAARVIARWYSVRWCWRSGNACAHRRDLETAHAEPGRDRTRSGDFANCKPPIPPLCRARGLRLQARLYTPASRWSAPHGLRARDRDGAARRRHGALAHLDSLFEPISLRYRCRDRALSHLHLRLRSAASRSC